MKLHNIYAKIANKRSFVVMILVCGLLSIVCGLIIAATQSWLFDTAADYTYDGSKITITGGAAELRNDGLFTVDADDTQAEFDAGVHTQTSWQTNKVALNTLPSLISMGNLVGYWNFNEASGNAKDGSGDWTGTLSGSPAYAAAQTGFGNAIDLVPASLQYVDMGDNDAFSFGTGTADKPFSVAAWIWMDDATNFSIVAKFNGGASAREWIFLTDSTDKLRLMLRDNSLNLGEERVYNTAALTSDQGAWIHVAATYDGTGGELASGGIRLYRNGIRVDDLSEDNGGYIAMENLAAPLTVGYMQVGANFYADGKIDDVLLYSRVLNPGEVAALANGGRPMSLSKPRPADTLDSLSSGLLSYWNFDEGTGQTVTDGPGTLNGTLGATSAVAADDPAWSTAARGGAGSLLFDGGDYANLGSDIVAGTGSFSVSAWINARVLSGYGNVYGAGIIRSSHAEAIGDFILAVNNEGKVKFYNWRTTGDDTTGLHTTTATPIKEGNWHHVAATWDGTTNKIYVDGTDYAFTDSATASGWGTEDAIGRGWTNPLYFIKGLIDEVGVWNRALSADEVKTSFHISKGLFRSATVDAVVTTPKWAGVRTTMSKPYGRPLEKPPVGYWKLEEGTGTAIDNAEGTAAMDGTLTLGAGGNTTVALAWASEIPNTAFADSFSLDFDGTDDYVTVADNAALDFGDTADFTISGWFKRDSATTDDVIIAKRNGIVDTDDGYIVYLDDVDDKLYFEVSEIAGIDEYQLVSTTTFTTATWNHFTVVWDQDSAAGSEIYINGVDDNATDTGTIGNIGDLSTALAFRIGTESDGGNPFDGRIDDIAVFDYVLSPAQIAGLGSGERQPWLPAGTYEKNLIGLWRLDNDANTSAGSVNGTAANMTWAAGIHNAAGDFNGTTSEITFASDPGTGVKTISFWMQADDNTTRKMIDIDDIDQIELDANGLVTATSFPGTVKIYVDGLEASQTIQGKWHHIAVTDTIGVEPTTGFEIGSSAAAFFDGRIDEVALFNAVLTAAQIKEIFERGATKLKLQASTGAADPPTSTWSGSGVSDKSAGLVAVWHLNGATSGAIANDATVGLEDALGTHNGTAKPNGAGMVWAQGQMFGAVDFDALDDFVQIADHNNLSFGNGTADTPFSVAAWINMVDATQFPILAKCPSTTEQEWAFWLDAADKLRLSLFDESASTDEERLYNTALTGDQGTWIHVAATYDGTGGASASDGIRLYRNGIRVDDTGADTGVYTAMENLTGTMRIGYFMDGGFPRFANDRIDDVALWKRALSGEEVYHLYQSGLGVVARDAQHFYGIQSVRYMQYRGLYESLVDYAGPDLQSLTLIASGFYPTDSPTVGNSSGLGFTYLTGFNETVNTPVGSAIQYILSPNDGATWSYYSAGWVTSNQTYAQSSPRTTINTQIATFDDSLTANGTLKWKAFLNSNGTANPQLQNLDAVYESASVTLIAPNNGESWSAGSIQNITWSSTGTVPNDLTLEYNTAGSITVFDQNIATNVGNHHNDELLSGVIAAWHFSEGTGTVLDNAEGTALRDGTLTVGAGGANTTTANAWLAGKFGNGLDFDGTDDYANAANLGTGIKTIAFWMKADVTASRKVINIDGAAQIELNVSSNVTATSFPGTTTIYVDGSAGANIPDVNWHHVTITDTTGVTPSTFEIGRVSTGYFDGKLEEIAMFNRVLSAAEISFLALANPGYRWTVPNPGVDAPNARVRVRSVSAPAIRDHSDLNFTMLAGFTVAGNVYSGEGSGALANKTVRVAVNGVDSVTTAESAVGTGAYSVTGVSASAGAVITVYLEDEVEDAVTVTVTNGAAMTGINLYQNYLITRFDNGAGSLTNANLATGAVAAEDDISNIYSVSGANLTVAAGKELFIPTGLTFAPAGIVNTHHLDIDGTLNAAGNAVNLTGDWQGGGVFTHGNNTVTFNGTTAQALTGETFYNLTINNQHAAPDDTNDVDSSAAVTVANTLNVNDGQFQPTTASVFKDVTIGVAGILKPDASAAVSVSGVWTNSGTFTANSGTVTFNGAADQNITTAGQAFYSLTLNNTGVDGLNDVIFIGNLDVNGLLTITNGDLDLTNVSNPNVTIAGGMTIGASADPLTRGVGTWIFDGTGTLTNSAAGSYNLGAVTANGSLITLTLVNSITMGALTIGADDTFALNSASNVVTLIATSVTNNNVFQLANAVNTLTLNLGGGAFTGNNIDFNGKSLTLTNVDYQLTLTLDAASDAVVLGDGNSKFDDMNIGTGAVAATFNAGVNNFEVSGNFTNNAAATFTHTGGTATFNAGAAGKTITSAGDSFYSMAFNNALGSWLLQDALTAGGNLTITAGTLDVDSNGDTVGGTISNINVAGNWSKSGTFNARTGTITFNGAADQNITTAGQAFYSLTLNNTGVDGLNDVIFIGNLDVNGLLTITNGDLDLTNVSNPNVTLAGGMTIGASADPLTRGVGTWIFDGTGTLTNSAAGSYNLGAVTADGSLITLTLVNSITMGALTIGANDTLALNGSANTVTLIATSVANNNVFQLANAVNTLTLNLGGGAFTGNNIDFNGKSLTLTNVDYQLTLTLDAASDAVVLGDGNSKFDDMNIGTGAVAATFNAGVNNFEVSGNFTNNAAATFTHTGGIATFNAGAAGKTITSAGDGFYSMTFNNALGSWLLQDALTAGGNLTITAGTLDVDSNGDTVGGTISNVNVGGNWSKSGTFNARTGTVTFNGSGAQIINDANTWYGLAVTASTARTVSFQSSVAQTVPAGGSLTLTGTAGNILSLAPGTAATAWLLNVNASASQIASYVSVSYSNASGGAEIQANDGTNTNGGNNQNWLFAVSDSEYFVRFGYTYNASTTTLTAKVWLEKNGKIQTNTSLLGTATLRIYNGTTLITTLSDTTADTNGFYDLSYNNSGGNLVSGTVYNIVAEIVYSSVNRSSGHAIAITELAELASVKSTVTSNATVLGTVNTNVSSIKTTVEGTDTKVVTLQTDMNSVKTAVGVGQAQTVYDKVGGLVTTIGASTDTSAAATVFGKIKDVRENLSGASGSFKLLPRQTTVKSGGTILIQAKAVSGLTGVNLPAVSVYDAADTLRINAVAMAEIGTTGIYKYSATIVAGWGTGAFTVLASQSSNMDSFTLNVQSTDLETVGTTADAIKTKTDTILWTDVSTIKTDVADMKPRVVEIQSDVNSLIANLVVGNFTATSAVVATTTSFSTNIVKGNDFYNDQLLIFTGGANAGQVRKISGFANINGVVTVTPALSAAPGTGDAFTVLANVTGASSADTAAISASVWNYAGRRLASASLDAGSLATLANVAAVETKVDTVDTVVDAIKLETDKITLNVLADLGLVKGYTDQVEGYTDTVEGTLATINGKVDTVTANLNNLIQDLIVASDKLVVADAGNSTTVMKSNLTNATNDFYKDQLVVFTSGNDAGQVRRISAYDGTTKVITLATALAQIPAATDQFTILANLAGGSAADNAAISAAVWAYATRRLSDSTLTGGGNIATAVNVSAVETKVDTVDTVVDAIKLETDKITANVLADLGLVKGYTDQVEGYVDTLEGTAAAIKLETDKITLNVLADLGLVKGYTDQVEGYTDTVEGTLATINGKVDTVTTNLNNLIQDLIVASDKQVVADAGNSTTVMKSNLTNATNDFYKDQLVVFTSGNDAGQVRRISAYDGTTKVITLATALAQIPAATDQFTILANLAGGSAADNAAISAAVWAYATRRLSDSTLTGGGNIATAVNVSAVETKVDTAQTDLTTLKGYTDQVEGYVDTLEGTAAAIKLETDKITPNVLADLGLVKGYTDQVEGYTDTVEGTLGTMDGKIDILDTNLDNLILDLIVGRQTVTIAVAPTTTAFSTTLTNASDNFYNDQLIVFTSGANAGQVRRVSAYNGTTKVITLGTALANAPANTDKFTLLSNVAGATAVGGAGGDNAATIWSYATRELTGDGLAGVGALATAANVSAVQTTVDNLVGDLVVASDKEVVADAGNSTTLFKSNLTNATADFYKDQLIVFTTGNNTGQVRRIAAYDGLTKVITLGNALAQIPAATDKFTLLSNVAGATAVGGAGGDNAATIWSYATRRLSDSTLSGGGNIATAVNVSAVETKVDTAQTDLTTLKGYTDQVEGYVDTLEATAAAIKLETDKITPNVLADLGLVKGYTDQVEGYVDTLEGTAAAIKLETDKITPNVLADLGLVKGYTDQVEGYVDQVEGYTDTVEGTLATINGKVDTVTANLNNLIQDLIVASDKLVVADAGNSTTVMKSNLTNATNDFYKDQLIVFTSGTNAGQVRRISAYDGTTKVITLATALAQIPAATDQFTILANLAGGSAADNAAISAAVWAYATRRLSDSTLTGGGNIATAVNVSAVETKVDTAQTDLTTLKGYTDQVEGYVDTLEGTAAAIKLETDKITPNVLADLGLVKGYTDQVEGYVDTLEGTAAAIKLETDKITPNVLADLGLVKGYTDQVEGYVDQVEGYTDTVEGTLATINGKVDTVTANLNNLIQDLIVASDKLVVADAGNSTTVMKSNLTNATNDFYKDQLIVFTSGTNAGQVRRISAYDGTTKVVTLATALSVVPGASDTFTILANLDGASASVDASTISTAVWNYAGRRLASATLDSGSLATLVNVSAVETKVDTAQTDLTTLKGYTDQVEGYVDTLETTAGAIKAKTDTINWSNVTAIQTDVDALNISAGNKGGRGQLLARGTKFAIGQTASLRFQHDPGLSPTVDIYGPDNKLLVTGKSMTDISGGKGIYNFDFKILSSYTKGEYTVMVTEASSGYTDSMVLSVLPGGSSDEDMATTMLSASSSSQSAAAAAKKTFEELLALKQSFGGTDDDKGMITRLGQIEAVMGQMQRNLSALTGQNANQGDTQVVTVSEVHDTVLDILKEIQTMAGQKGINLDAVYNTVEGQGESTTELKNMVTAVQTISKTTQEMIEKAQDKPVMTTWFEG